MCRSGAGGTNLVQSNSFPSLPSTDAAADYRIDPDANQTQALDYSGVARRVLVPETCWVFKQNEVVADDGNKVREALDPEKVQQVTLPVDLHQHLQRSTQWRSGRLSYQISVINSCVTRCPKEVFLDILHRN